jgi:GT2 family glycosyltransferase
MLSPRDDVAQATYNLTCFREYLGGLRSEDRGFLPSFSLWGPRRAFVEVDGFDESWSGAEDLDLTIRLRRAGWPLRFEANGRVLHRPAARSFWRIVRHGWAHGGTSMRARAQYPTEFGAPRIARSPVALALLGPLVAAYLLLRTYLDHPSMRWVFWRAAPTIYFFRVAWCLGAAWSLLRPGRVFEPVANRG